MNLGVWEFYRVLLNPTHTLHSPQDSICIRYLNDEVVTLASGFDSWISLTGGVAS